VAEITGGSISAKPSGRTSNSTLFWWPTGDPSNLRQVNEFALDQGVDPVIILRDFAPQLPTIRWHRGYPQITLTATSHPTDQRLAVIEANIFLPDTTRIPVPFAAANQFGTGEDWFPLPGWWAELVSGISSLDSNNANIVTVSIGQVLRLHRWASNLSLDDRTQYDQIQASPLITKAQHLEQIDDYQLAGVKWLVSRSELEISSVLADGMGIGKTSQALVAINELTLRGIKPSLVLCPPSLIPNWLREAERFTPDLRIVAADNMTPVLRQNYDCLIASIDCSDAFMKTLSEIDWGTLVVDEAQYIKNQATRRWEKVAGMSCQSRILLTGTPIETSPGDVFSLVEACHPGILGEENAFIALCEANPDLARSKIAPFMLRRNLQTVGIHLPDLVIEDKIISMSPGQTSRYANTVERIRRGELNGLQAYQALKSIVMYDDADSVYSGLGPKGEQLARLLDEVRSERRKCLIFAHEVREMDAIVEICNLRHLPVTRISGDVPKAERQKIVDAFQSLQGAGVLVLSIRAAAVGLNLQSASVVVFTSLEWNPAIEDQATARAWRRGQEKRVVKIRLAYANSIDETILERSRARAAQASELAPSMATPSGRVLAELLKEAVKSWAEVRI
jgi:SNF2 family DNA or RNA helicase